MKNISKKLAHMSYFFIEKLKLYYVLEFNRDTLRLDLTISGFKARLIIDGVAPGESQVRER